MNLDPRQSPPLDSGQKAWLGVCAAATMLPHLAFVPTWLALSALGLLAVYGLSWWRRLPLPSPAFLLILALALGLGVFLQFQQFFGREPGLAFLLVLACLKLFETKSVRDGRALVLLCLFLQMGLFLHSQSLSMAAMTALTLVLAVATLAALSQGGRPAELLRLSVLMLAQASPFMLVLFLLFPRIQGPLWGLPADAFGGTTGLSDTMSPGAISRLSLSEAVAFRARFAGPMPPQSQLYWRGPVLTRFDGRTWRSAPVAAAPKLAYPVPDGPVFRHAMTLEASDRPWLLALEMPLDLPREARMGEDFQVLAGAPLRERFRYEASSRPGLPVGLTERPLVFTESLALPARFNPRARALGEAWRTAGGGTEAILRQASTFFRTSHFIYTLAPPILGENWVDEFLFDTRRGFCEHFAGSFVFLMRAAGVPARVVTGYQGGELNPMDGYLTVRQSDAHAWAEVWLPGEGWRRVDPTAVSAPARVEQNLPAAMPAGEALPVGMRLGSTWIKNLRWGWEALGNGWNQWVLGYNPERQRALLERFGLPDWPAMTAALAALIASLMLLLMAWTLRRRAARDPALAAWERLSGKLARIGLARGRDEGPAEYRDRVAADRPELSVDMERIAALYIAQRYGRAPAPETLRWLGAAVRRFKT
jgi:transglutaminase-like putative cysteine protease